MEQGSFKNNVRKLGGAEGGVFAGEAILGVTKALLQSGVSHITARQGAPIGRLIEVLATANVILEALGAHVGNGGSDASEAATLVASVKLQNLLSSLQSVGPAPVSTSPLAPLPESEHLASILRREEKSGAIRACNPPAASVASLKKEAFSEREVEILKLLSCGLGNRDLAARLFLSEATIKWHLHNVYVKLNVRNRSSAVARALPLLYG